MRHKRPSVALAPAIADRARALRATGLSYRAVVAQLEREGLGASLAAVHAACQVAAPDAGALASERAGGATAEDVDDVDALERADELRAIAGEAVLEVRETLRAIRAQRAGGAGAVGLDDAVKLLGAAERAEKLARLLEGRGPGAGARGGAAAAAVAKVEVTLTPAERAVVAALDGQGPAA